MIRSLTLENFRAFRRLSMEGLGRVNLCVGTNNCGKTSVLEAIRLLAAKGRPEALLHVLRRRGEWRWHDPSRGRFPAVEVRHLFHGHELEANRFFSVAATNDALHTSFSARLVERAAISDVDPGGVQTSELFPPGAGETELQVRLALDIEWRGQSSVRQVLPLNRSGGLSADAVDRPGRRVEEDPTPVRFVATEALASDEIVALFEEIVLTPEEESVLEALRTIEPHVERIAPVGTERRRSYADFERGGLAVKLRNSLRRIPIGSMGEGIWRLLGIALSLTKAKGGILLIDEIDTGLHHTVMEDMWRLVHTTAQRLDVQVFATTHSRDCVESLGAISRPDVTDGSEVSIQRIERSAERAVAFNERDIVQAAKRSIEVR